MGAGARYLVTGGAGFIGSHLAAALLERGDAVRVLDDFSSGKPENLAGLAGDLEVRRGDLRDPAAVASAVAGCAGVFHAGARPSVVESVADPRLCYEVNFMGTVNVLEAARRAGVRVVYSASAAAYGDLPVLPKHEDAPLKPLSPYGAAKLAGEQALRASCHVHGLQGAVLRYFNVYGPRQAPDSPYSGVIARFTRQLLSGEAPRIDGDGAQTRDFTYVADVVRANLLAMQARLPRGAVLNIARGERVSVLELFHALKRALCSPLEPSFGPPRPGDVPHSQADIGRARDLLGYRPTVSLGEGIARTVAWYKENTP